MAMLKEGLVYCEKLRGYSRQWLIIKDFLREPINEETQAQTIMPLNIVSK